MIILTQLAYFVLAHPVIQHACWWRLASTMSMQFLHLQHWQFIALISQLKEVL
jgi:hypothetical protein